MISPEMAAAKRAAKAELGSLPGVTGVGIGKDAVRVYIENAEVCSKLPSEILGIRIEPVISGPIKAYRSQQRTTGQCEHGWVGVSADQGKPGEALVVYRALAGVAVEIEAHGIRNLAVAYPSKALDFAVNVIDPDVLGEPRYLVPESDAESVEKVDP